jgi:hypothetical protein
LEKFYRFFFPEISECFPGFFKKTRMKSKTSHPSNENFTLRTQFPVVLSIVDKTQNFHDNIYGKLRSVPPGSICLPGEPGRSMETYYPRESPGQGGMEEPGGIHSTGAEIASDPLFFQTLWQHFCKKRQPNFRNRSFQSLIGVNLPFPSPEMTTFSNDTAADFS